MPYPAYIDMRNMASYKNNKSVCPLFHFPNVVGFEELHEVVVFLLTLHLFDLLSNGSLIGRSLYVADYAESHWESMLVVHPKISGSPCFT